MPRNNIYLVTRPDMVRLVYSWEEADLLTNGIPHALPKGFSDESEADAAYRLALKKRGQEPPEDYKSGGLPPLW